MTELCGHVMWKGRWRIRWEIEKIGNKKFERGRVRTYNRDKEHCSGFCSTHIPMQPVLLRAPPRLWTRNRQLSRHANQFALDQIFKPFSFRSELSDHWGQDGRTFECGWQGKWKTKMYLPAPGFRATNPRILAVLMIHPLCPVEWGSCLRNCPHAYLQPRKTLRVLRFLCSTIINYREFQLLGWIFQIVFISCYCGRTLFVQCA